jgi:sodium-dependent dicarboxylate transporter 2/3/5
MKLLGYIFGAVCFLGLLLLPTFPPFESAALQMVQHEASSVDPQLIAASMQRVLAVTILMVIWWLTEAVPLAATALLPAILFPLLQVTGLRGPSPYPFGFREVLVNYANPVIFLFLGGFLLAGAMQKWKLDRRFTLWLLTRGNIANDSRLVLLGMMAASALLSMWISNTATAAMMLPLALGVLRLMGIDREKQRFGKAMMLGVAWAASIGGVATIIGSPPNGVAIGILSTTFRDNPSVSVPSFLGWMSFGVPYVILFLPLAWRYLLAVFPPDTKGITGGKERLLQERGSLGPLSRGETGTITVFALAVMLWVTNPFWGSLLPAAVAGRLAWLDEYSIGLLCGALGFFVPIRLKRPEFLLDWRDTKHVEWGTLILFGGGIALSDAMLRTGLAGWVAMSFVESLGMPSEVFLVLAIVLLVNFLTEVTSNTAVTSMLVPIVISIAAQTGSNPVMLSVAAAVAASMAFMLPVATPPNALVFGTGYLTIREMAKRGFVLNLAGWVVTTFVILVIGHYLLGVFA